MKRFLLALLTAALASTAVLVAAPPPPAAAAANVPAVLAAAREMNYYPANGGWTYMWTRFSPATINADFAKLSSQGFNTVRVILQADNQAFNYPTPTAAQLDRLNQVIGMAAANGLKVDLTLFDFWGVYSDIAGSKQWADAVVKPYAGDPRISMIDLQNEIDPAAAGSLDWAKQMIPYLRSISGGIPVTVSEYSVSRMQLLVDALSSTAASTPDFYNFHLYGAYGTAHNVLSRVKAMVGSVPLYIGEFGYSTALDNAEAPGGLQMNQASTEAFQEYQFRAIGHAARVLGLNTPAAWAYSDFAADAIPYNAAAKEYKFGINRLDGTAKPVASSWQAIMAGGAISRDFNGGFEGGDTTGYPLLWRVHQSSASGYTATFARDTAVHRSGGASARISQSTATASAVPSFNLNPITEIVAGRSYTLSGWMSGSAAAGKNTMSISWFDQAGTYLGQSETPASSTGTFAWQERTITANAPANAAKAELHLKSAANTGTVWFDDVTFTDNTVVTPPPPPPASGTVTLTSPAAGQVRYDVTVNATTSVDASKVEYFAGTTKIGEDLTCCTWDEIWNTTTVANGTYAVTAKATFPDGSVATSAPVSVKVRNLSPSGAVPAKDETQAFASGSGDIADDPAIWVDTANPSRSVVIGANKADTGGGLAVYDLDGNQLQFLSVGKLNNVDLRSNVLGGKVVVTASNRSNGTLAYFLFDPVTRTLAKAGTTAVGFEPYGTCMYVSPASGNVYAFVTQRVASGASQLDQYRLAISGSTVSGTKVRDLSTPTLSEACVADDETEVLYVSEEDSGIYSYNASSAGGAARTAVDLVSGPHLVADVEGLAIARDPGGPDYLVASSQGDSTYQVYDAAAPHTWRKSFTVGASASGAVDAASETDGLALVWANLGTLYPNGLLVVHDNANSGGVVSNFKFVDAGLPLAP